LKSRNLLKAQIAEVKQKIYQLIAIKLCYLSLTLIIQTVRDFKMALVKRFDDMEKELQARKIERATEKVTTRSLTDAVQNWENKSQHSYSHIRNLLVKACYWHAVILTLRNATQAIKQVWLTY
jgi:phage regulator Rha-like protein